MPEELHSSHLHEANRSFVLASGSPRRFELMSDLGFEPIVRVANIEEARQPGESASEYVRRLAFEKAEAVAHQLDGDDTLPAWILAADTTVLFDGKLLEKPADAEQARQMLRTLSGSTHLVMTALCWYQRFEGSYTIRLSHAEVDFRRLDEDSIERYVSTGEPMDKAGAYGIQGLGGAFVRSIRGSYTCIVGLPVFEVVEELRAMGGVAGFPFRVRSEEEE